MPTLHSSSGKDRREAKSSVIGNHRNWCVRGSGVFDGTFNVLTSDDAWDIVISRKRRRCLPEYSSSLRASSVASCSSTRALPKSFIVEQHTPVRMYAEGSLRVISSKEWRESEGLKLLMHVVLELSPRVLRRFGASLSFLLFPSSFSTA